MSDKVQIEITRAELLNNNDYMLGCLARQRAEDALAKLTGGQLGIISSLSGQKRREIVEMESTGPTCEMDRPYHPKEIDVYYVTWKTTAYPHNQTMVVNEEKDVLKHLNRLAIEPGLEFSVVRGTRIRFQPVSFRRGYTEAELDRLRREVI